LSVVQYKVDTLRFHTDIISADVTPTSQFASSTNQTGYV